MWGAVPSQAQYRGAQHRTGQDLAHENLDDLVPGGRVDVQLIRQSIDEPWGFAVERVPGTESSLMVQRVFGGSAADNQQLMRGDVIAAVNGSDVAYLTYSEALELINQADLELVLTIDSQPAQFSPQQYKRQDVHQAQPHQQQQQKLLQQQLQLQQQQQQQQALKQQQQLFQQQLLQQQLDEQQRQLDYEQLEQLQQDEYDVTERPSRSRAPPRSDLADESQDFNGLRSSSAGPPSRGRQNVKFNPPQPSNLMEFGWTPKSKPISQSNRSVSQGALAGPGWTPRPKPKPKAPVYPSMTEMGWSPKPRETDMGWSTRSRATAPQAHASNPSLNEMGWAPKVKSKPLSVSTTNVNSLQSPDIDDLYQEESYEDPSFDSSSYQQQSNVQPARAGAEPAEQQHFAPMPAWFNSLRTGGTTEKKATAGAPRSNEFGWTPQGLNPRPVQSPAAQFTSMPHQSPSRGQQSVGQQQQQRQQVFGQTYDNEPHWTSYPKKAPHRSQTQASGNQERFVSQIQNIQLSNKGWSTPTVQQSPPVQQMNAPQYQPLQQQQKIRPSAQSMSPAMQVPYVPTQISGPAQQRSPSKGQQLRSQTPQAQRPQLQPGPQVQQIKQGQAPQPFAMGQQYRQPIVQASTATSGYQTAAGPRATVPEVAASQVASVIPQAAYAVPQAAYAAPQAAYVIPQAGIPQAAFTIPQAGIPQTTVSQASVPQATVPQAPASQAAAPQPKPLVSQTAVVTQVPASFNAFVDFYVLESRVSSKPISEAVAQVSNTKPGEYQGGFVDFYVVADRSTQGVQGKPTERPQQPPVEVRQPAAPSPSAVPSFTPGTTTTTSNVAAGKTRTGGFIDFYVLPEGSAPAPASAAAAAAVSKPSVQQIKSDSSNTVTRSGGFIDFYVLPEGADVPSSVKPSPSPSAASSGKIQSGGFVDFYVISTADGATAKSTVAKQQPSQGTAAAASTQAPVAGSGPGKEIAVAQPSPAEQPKSQAAPQSSKAPEAKPQPSTANSVVQAATDSKTVVQVSKNGKTEASEADKPVLPGKIGNGAGAQAKPQEVQQKPGVQKVQKLSTPSAFKDQLKPTKPLPGKLK